MTKIILAQELLEQGLSQIDVSERLGISRLTQWVEEWLRITITNVPISLWACARLC